MSQLWIYIFTCGLELAGPDYQGVATQGPHKVEKYIIVC